MAVVSTPHAVSTLTPPSSSHGASDAWSFSVPIQNQNPQIKSVRSQHNTEPEVNEGSETGLRRDSRLSHHVSRPELSSMRTATYDSTHSSKSHQSSDGNYLAPSRVSAPNRKDSNISDTGSAPDSLIELYGSRGSGANSMDLSESKNADSTGKDEDPDRSRWIHRDKLARIESQELQAAGIILPRQRPASKAGRRDRSRDLQTNGTSRSEHFQKRQKVDAPPEQADEDESANWDLRSPEEVAAEKQSLYGSWRSDKSLSRLPLPKNSPLPIPLDYIVRDTPVQRKQSGGWNGDDDQIAYPKRGRSGSIPLDDTGAAAHAPAKRAQSEASPNKKGISTAGRKPSGAPGSRVTSAQTKPKARSDTSTSKENQRPSTRSGELGPSSSVKAPEGDPPWLATMYKPDPRLPPDQQLLPTVAKRLQQEQWEKEGKFGNAYDTLFRPMNEDQFQQRPPSKIITQTIEAPVEKSENADNWPLQSPKSPTLSSGRPGTAGGYSTMPKITSNVTNPVISPKASMAAQPQRESMRLQEPPAEDKKKGGCGCCVVM